MQRLLFSKWSTGAIIAIASVATAVTVARADNPAADKPIPSEIQNLLKARAIQPSAPIYIRVFKESSELEVWKMRADGRYLPIRTYPICTWSGALGPKQVLGDQMAPEGFYGFGVDGLKPDSKYHLALNVGYPNALDRALGRTGNFIMVHGQCVSVGCFAMTNDLIEEIYALARDALAGGVERVPVHIFPFRMTPENMARHAGHPAQATWGPLKEAYDEFALTHEPPRIAVCGSRYVVNPLARVEQAAKDACPARIGKLLAPLSPRKSKKIALTSTPLFADGPKTRSIEDIAAWEGAGTRSQTAIQSKDRASAVVTVPGSMTPLLGNP
jgi:murein L,D-transpeptidase YafK